MAFIGRTEEISLLTQALNRESTAILIYGKRKIGKTTLIKHVLETRPEKFIYFECLKNTVKENLDAFAAELVRLQILPIAVNFKSFSDLFVFLNTLPYALTVVIDEYPYLKAMTATEIIDSSFQNIIDNRLKNIHLILSGSHIGMMKDLLMEKNALYGRFDAVLHLTEMPYNAAADFYRNKSSYEKIAFHSVFGGSPYVLEKIDQSESLKENIINTILNQNTSVYLYASHLLMSDYSNSVNAERIFSVLGNGKKTHRDIESKLDSNKTGNVSKQLKILTQLELIKKVNPINRLDDNKKTTYEINDNLMRFYFTYVYRNQSALQMVGPAAFYDLYVEGTLRDFISRRFEEICRNYFSIQVRRGALSGIRNIGTYYFDDSRTKTNGEFDIALDYGGHYGIFEAKYLKGPMDLDDIYHELGQIHRIKAMSISQIGFISANGFVSKEEGLQFYTGDDLYEV